jgi:hypothetical protein
MNTERNKETRRLGAYMERMKDENGNRKAGGEDKGGRMKDDLKTKKKGKARPSRRKTTRNKSMGQT